MQPDDPRHGTCAGYCAGCRDTCCRTAQADYARARRARLYLHGPTTVPAIGSKRRIQALIALGYSTRILDAHMGMKPTYSTAVLMGADEIHRTTANRIADLYDDLSMKLPPTEARYQKQVASRNRNLAIRNGWVPPLAWTNIDDPNEQPTGRRGYRADHRPSNEVDEAVVFRVLNGERMPTTVAEKNAIVRHWTARGRPLSDLERLHGINPDRHKEAS